MLNKRLIVFSSVFCIADYGILQYLDELIREYLLSTFSDKPGPKWHVKKSNCVWSTLDVDLKG